MIPQKLQQPYNQIFRVATHDMKWHDRMATPPLPRVDLEKTLFHRFFVVKGFVALRASPILHQIDLIGRSTLWTAYSG